MVKMTQNYKLADLLYENPLACERDVEGFRLEGRAEISFPAGKMRMRNLLDPSEGQKSNFVFWCPVDFPSDISISWEFWPVLEPGLCILFFAARGRNGEDLFDPNLSPRDGQYKCYNRGDINALHISYFRRTTNERNFNRCNLRKSYGFHLVAQGADPIPSVIYATPPYHMQLDKFGTEINFFINDLKVLQWVDDGITYGPVHSGGKIGFRQMAPLIGEYANLKVHSIVG